MSGLCTQSRRRVILRTSPRGDSPKFATPKQRLSNTKDTRFGGYAGGRLVGIVASAPGRTRPIQLGARRCFTRSWAGSGSRRYTERSSTTAWMPAWRRPLGPTRTALPAGAGLLAVRRSSRRCSGRGPDAQVHPSHRRAFPWSARTVRGHRARRYARQDAQPRRHPPPAGNPHGRPVLASHLPRVEQAALRKQRLASTRVWSNTPPALLLDLIHRSAWKGNSANFGCRGF